MAKKKTAVPIQMTLLGAPSTPFVPTVLATLPEQPKVDLELKPIKWSKAKRIAEEGEAIQAEILAPLQGGYSRIKAFPPLHGDMESFRRILYGTEGSVGLDFEFNRGYNASHIGIANREEACCVRSTPDLIRELVDELERKGRTFVGHSVLGAEKRVIEKALGRDISIALQDDSMVSFHLMNADLCGNVQKTEDAEEKGSLGLMGLDTASVMHSMLPAWKTCIGPDCDGYVCPIHNKANYCAVDAYASLEDHEDLMEQMDTYAVHKWYYREKMELAEIALKMEEQGIKVDREYVKDFEARSDSEKEKLFPYVQVGKERVFSVFNPRSPDQILQYFRGHGINLAKVDKEAVRNALEREAIKYGFDPEELEEIPQDAMSGAFLQLWNLDKFKSQGKGLDPWFADKYLDENDLLHPRFVTTGTAMDRWSSSKPNATNIPSKGNWGKMVKRGIIPRHAGLEIADCDASQLEFRMILFQSGWDCADIPNNVFEVLVENASGGFKYAADFMEKDERDIAKIVVYGTLYGQGMALIEPYELDSAYIQGEIAAGARKVYLKKYGSDFDWTFRGKIVTFTGKAMSKAIFRDKTRANRKRALVLTDEVLMKTFNIRKWQYESSKAVEDREYAQCPYTGKILHLYGTTEECMKSTWSFLGQGCSAVHTQGVTLRMYREAGIVPLMTVHDSWVLEFPKEFTDAQLKEHLHFAFEPTHRIPGFYTPAGIKRGPSYGELRKLVL